MIGQARGMANELLRMMYEKRGLNRRLGVDVHCLWCLDHRLNLIAQDFKVVENVNFVIRFLKWFTASDRLVSYTAFSRRRSLHGRTKKYLLRQKPGGYSTEMPSDPFSIKLKPSRHSCTSRRTWTSG